jgi:hypothetical protein
MNRIGALMLQILASVFARANSYLFAIRHKSKKTRAKTQMRWH